MAQKSSTPSTHRTPAKKKVAPKKVVAKRVSTQAKSKSQSISKSKAKRPATAKVKRYRFHRPVEHRTKVPSVWRLTQKSVAVIWQNPILFLGITLIYTLLSLLLVQGLSASMTTVKSTFGAFATLISSSATTSGPTAGPYQFMLAVITSLAAIWVLRQVLSGGARPRIRDSFYRGMYPLIPFILILIVMCVQLLPFVIGGRIYATIITNDLSVRLFEKVLWLLMFLGLASWSLYMLTASAFALYIVTLPDMPPLKALRSARNLVRYRRWTVLRKILGLPLILLVISALITVPIILVLPSAAAWIFFVLSMIALVAIHVYMYTLYRELLNE
jgi:hypothetical protein